jgi:glycosyltransferase involved in cell wall biosynthesis
VKKLIIQIPCLNEEEQLPTMLSQLPREVAGFDVVEWLVIDDGSTDGTLRVAREHGIDHIVRLTHNKGLASAFQAGMDAALKLGADVIVNTDADNQYDSSAIPALVAPILDGSADMVIGDRDVASVDEFSRSKKVLQKLGTRVVQWASGTSVQDATSGFRAYNREAALQLVVVSKFTYTLESLIQAGKNLVAIDNVLVSRNDATRPSRLFKSTGAYVRRNSVSIFRVWSSYEPLKVFWATGVGLALLAVLLWMPYIVSVIRGTGGAHLQSIVLGSVFMIAAVQLFSLGVLADLVASSRVVSQRTLERVRRIELTLGVPPSHYEKVVRDETGSNDDQPTGLTVT